MSTSNYILFLVICLVLGIEPSHGPEFIIIDKDEEQLTKKRQLPKYSLVKSKVLGTGRTTGHIATLIVKNQTDTEQQIAPKEFYIPSEREYQSYYARIVEPQILPPNQETSIPIEGYCLDIHRPPVPLGEFMPPISKWISVEQEIKIQPSTSWYHIETDRVAPTYNDLLPVTAKNSKAFLEHSETNQKIEAVWPGTQETIPYYIKPTKEPMDVVGLIVEIVNRIEEAADHLLEEGEIQTPFYQNPNKQRESIIQQTIWITMGTLKKQKYEKEDFTERLYEQYLTTTQQEIADISSDDKEELDKGVEQFWGSFMATGVEAKVIKEPIDAPTLIQANSDDDDCRCDTLRATLKRLNELGIYEELASLETTTFRSVGSEELEDQDLTAEEFEEIELEVTDVEFICSCQDTLDCTPYNDRRMDDDHEDKFEVDFSLSRTARVGSIEEESDEEGASATITPNSNFRNIYVYIRLKAYCMNEECDRATCVRKFEIQFKLNDEEE